jgi:hypothetical protein
MRQRRCWKQFTGNQRFTARTVTRRLVPAAAIVLAAAAAAAIGPRALSEAAVAPAAAATPSGSTSGISWTPSGLPAQQDDNGACAIAMSGTVTEASASATSQVAAVLNSETPDSVNQDGIRNFTVSAPENGSGSASMTVYGDSQVDCSLVNQADAYIRKDGYGSLGQFTQAVTDDRLHPAPAGSPRARQQHATLLAYDALPSWLRGAIAAVVGGVAYAVFGWIVVSAVLQFFPAGPAVGMFSGCVAGVVGTAVALAIAGDSFGPVNAITAGIGGCVAGAAATQVSLDTIKQFLSVLIGVVLTSNLTAVLGSPITADASAAGVDLSPFNTAVQDASQALSNP